MFQLGAQCGLKKCDVLDLSLEEFQAEMHGYEDHIRDLQKIAVQQGYWSAYYGNTKHAKSVQRICESLDKPEQAHVDTVDVDQFLEMERNFNKAKEDITNV